MLSVTPALAQNVLQDRAKSVLSSGPGRLEPSQRQGRALCLCEHKQLRFSFLEMNIDGAEPLSKHSSSQQVHPMLQQLLLGLAGQAEGTVMRVGDA